MTDDEAAGTTDVRINIAGPWDMKELDGMVIDENSLYYGFPDDEFTSLGGSIGRLMMIANGSADDLTLLVGENGALDDLAYRLPPLDLGRTKNLLRIFFLLD